MKIKGQAAIEFMAYVSVFIFAFLGILFIFSNLSTSQRSQSTYTMALTIGNRVSQIMSIMSSSPIGMYYRTSLPSTINKANYSIKVDVNTNLLFVSVHDEFNTTAVVRFPDIVFDSKSPCLHGSYIDIYPNYDIFVSKTANGVYISQEVC